MNRFSNLLALGAFAVAALIPPAHASDAKPRKMKLETLKKAPVQIDPAYGYLIVRLGPKSATEKPTIVVFNRVVKRDALGVAEPDLSDKKEFERSLAVMLIPSRSFEDRDGVGTYILKVYPGRWALMGVGQTCMSLGTYTVDVKAGEVVDFGTVLAAREDGKTTVPELKGIALSEDLQKYGTLMNIVMSDAVYVKPAVAKASVPAELANVTVTPGALTADYRTPNTCRALINRAASLPPLARPAPVAKAEAKAIIERINSQP